jgi:hypothetical protein
MLEKEPTAEGTTSLGRLKLLMSYLTGLHHFSSPCSSLHLASSAVSLLDLLLLPSRLGSLDLAREQALSDHNKASVVHYCWTVAQQPGYALLSPTNKVSWKRALLSLASFAHRLLRQATAYIMDTKVPMGDPNFPDNLSIVASTRKVIKLAAARRAEAEGVDGEGAGAAEMEDDKDDAAQDIGGFGIAGR